MAIRFVYFDCMDTLIQTDTPSIEVYAEWAYEGARELGLWPDLESFRRDWTLHRERFHTQHGELREGTIRARIREILTERVAQAGKTWTQAKVEEEVTRIHQLYWALYRASSFVLPEVRESLERIQRENEVPLGVVSNFMVEGGIPALLEEHGLDRFFQVVLVSCDHGYRKPSEVLFKIALQAAGVDPAEILFVGDNPTADYHGPRAVGMTSLLYDRLRLHPAIEHRVESFPEIEEWMAERGSDGSEEVRFQ